MFSIVTLGTDSLLKIVSWLRHLLLACVTPQACRRLPAEPPPQFDRGLLREEVIDEQIEEEEPAETSQDANGSLLRERPRRWSGNSLRRERGLWQTLARRYEAVRTETDGR